MPHDMEQRVTDRIKQENGTRHWLRPASIIALAASILILLTLHFADKDVEPTATSMTARQTEQLDNRTKVAEKSAGDEKPDVAKVPVVAQEPIVAQAPAAAQPPAAAQRVQARHQAGIENTTIRKAKAAPAASTAEQLNNCIARLEAEMEAVDDSVRSAHLEKLIEADVRLQLLVNRIVKDEAEQAMRELQKDSTANYITF